MTISAGTVSARAAAAFRPERRIDTALRILAVVLLVEQLYAVGLVQHPGLLQPLALGSDSSNYYAAGLRLNAGHPLYGPLQAGDLPVPGYPRIYPAPLLSPPFVAVLWRPLAVLPEALAIGAWWLGGLLLTVGLVLWFAWRGTRRELLLLLAVLMAGVPIALLRRAGYPYLGFDSPVAIGAFSGNINTYLTGLLVLAWWARAPASARLWARPGALTGMAIAAATALKLGPITLAAWSAARRPWTEIAWLMTGLLVFGLIGVVGAGVDAHLEYARVALGGGIVPSTLSLPGLLSIWLRVPIDSVRLATVAVLPVGLAAVWLLRRHERAAFAVAVLTSIYASPVVLPGNFLLMLAVATPDV